MFWKSIELISRIVSARRIRHVNRVGEAATLAQTDPEAALQKLAEMERKIHPAVRSMHALTWGRVLDGLGRTAEAEAKVIHAAKLDPSNMYAHLELAKMAGRKFQFKNARERLVRLSEEPESAVQEQAIRLIEKLDDIRTGKEAKRYTKEALKMARLPVGEIGVEPGLPADFSLLDSWIDTQPAEAVLHIDGLAFLLGESLVQKGGTWKISLSPRHSLIVFDDDSTLCPFELISNRFNDSSLSLLKSVSSYSK